MVAIYSIQNYLVEKFLLLLYYMRLMYIYIINLYTQFYEEYLNTQFNDNVLFIKNREIVNIDKNNVTSLKPDFCVITYKNENQNMVKVTEDLTFIDSDPPNKCMFTFILVSLETEYDKYDITTILNNNTSTYYLENTILFDSNFMTWLSLKHITCPMNNFTINVIDHNANQFTLSNKQFIKLGLNNYYIDQIKE